MFVPVLGPAGGCGRSVVAGLLGAGLASYGSAVVLDTGLRWSSPWPNWAAAPGGGLVAIPPQRAASGAQVVAASSRCTGLDGADFAVLTDHQAWGSAPLSLPEDPWAWYQLAAAGGWQVAVADTSYAVADEVVFARSTRTAGVTSRWCGLPCALPVLCMPATTDGAQLVQGALMAASAEGLPVARMTVAVVSAAPGAAPAPVKAAVTMLEPRVAAVVEVPFDPHVRAYGLREMERLKARTRRAAAALAGAVMGAARESFGDPLPAAPRPAPMAGVPAVEEEVSV
ncbi:hypothetical protein [Streptomyces smaragdinus]|uniref:hypothetical protein n=1 Tax=Streptomyces smaragdinus TaxID=2585196 RepID=UPI002B2186B7|nr:hypothetical protein [Streptomyces smaragdinus]